MVNQRQFKQRIIINFRIASSVLHLLISAELRKVTSMYIPQRESILFSRFDFLGDVTLSRQFSVVPTNITQRYRFHFR